MAASASGRRRLRPRQVVAGTLQGVLPSTAAPAPPWAASRAGDDYGAPATPSWRDVDWRRHVRDVEIQGRRVRYADLGAGDGPPVVFVHGLGGNWQNWLENLPSVAQSRRALALDLPGFGRSEMPAEQISISRYAGAVDLLCEKLGLGAVAVVGNSMGGFISAELAIRFPKRVERLALVAAAGISITNLRRRPTVTAARINAAISARTVARGTGVVLRPRLREAALSFIFRHPSRMRRDLLYEVIQGTGGPGFVPAMEALTSYDFRDRLPEIGCPTLLLWGREDMLVPSSDADEFERLIDGSRKVVMDDTGHVPMLERPDAFNDCLAEFLVEEGAGEGGETQRIAAS